MRILIVDDEPACRHLVALCLKPHGTISQADNGPSALAAISSALGQRQPFDLIMLDISMPVIDGQVALRTLRLMEEAHGVPLGKGAKVIMTTGHGDPRTVMQAFRGTADGYLVKPLDPAKLTELIAGLGLI